MSGNQQADLFADPGELAKVVKYHLVPGCLTADDLLDRLFLKTLIDKVLVPPFTRL